MALPAARKDKSVAKDASRGRICSPSSGGSPSLPLLPRLARPTRPPRGEATESDTTARVGDSPRGQPPDSELLFEQVFEGGASVEGSGGGGFALDGGADHIERAIVVGVLAWDAFRDGLRALEAR